MNVIICEDTKEDAAVLHSHIQKYFKSINCPVNIIAYNNGDSFLEDFEAKKLSNIQIVFLDIYMPGINGINLAKKIRRTNDEIVVVFTTMSDNHALDGFAVSALQYLLKPVDYLQVESTLSKCIKLFADSLRFIAVLSGRLTVKIYLKDIMYIEVFNSTILIHTVSETIKSYLSLSELEKQLEGSTFLRTHRSYVVNMCYINDMDTNNFILKDNTVIPIRRDDKLKIKQIYRDYLSVLTWGM
jgi:DNA-binding LytR/AlgR family response regulator